jgi:hypothetical protein
MSNSVIEYRLDRPCGSCARLPRPATSTPALTHLPSSSRSGQSLKHRPMSEPPDASNRRNHQSIRREAFLICHRVILHEIGTAFTRCLVGVESLLRRS